jgi:hypothetical protein
VLVQCELGTPEGALAKLTDLIELARQQRRQVRWRARLSCAAAYEPERFPTKGRFMEKQQRMPSKRFISHRLVGVELLKPRPQLTIFQPCLLQRKNQLCKSLRNDCQERKYFTGSSYSMGARDVTPDVVLFQICTERRKITEVTEQTWMSRHARVSFEKFFRKYPRSKSRKSLGICTLLYSGNFCSC